MIQDDWIKELRMCIEVKQVEVNNLEYSVIEKTLLEFKRNCKRALINLKWANILVRKNITVSLQVRKCFFMEKLGLLQNLPICT